MLGAPKPPINALKIEVTVEPPQTGKRAQGTQMGNLSTLLRGGKKNQQMPTPR